MFRRPLSGWITEWWGCYQVIQEAVNIIGRLLRKKIRLAILLCQSEVGKQPRMEARLNGCLALVAAQVLFVARQQFHADLAGGYFA